MYFHFIKSVFSGSLYIEFVPHKVHLRCGSVGKQTSFNHLASLLCTPVE